VLFLLGLRSGRYDELEFKNYNIPMPIMSLVEDQDENLWLGRASGLYYINTKGTIVNVTTKGS